MTYIFDMGSGEPYADEEAVYQCAAPQQHRHPQPPGATGYTQPRLATLQTTCIDQHAAHAIRDAVMLTLKDRIEA